MAAQTTHTYLCVCGISRYVAYVYHKTISAQEKRVLIHRVIVHIGANKKAVRIKTDRIVGLAGKTPVIVYSKGIVTIRICKPRIVHWCRIFPFGTGKENSAADQE